MLFSNRDLSHKTYYINTMIFIVHMLDAMTLHIRFAMLPSATCFIKLWQPWSTGGSTICEHLKHWNTT